MYKKIKDIKDKLNELIAELEELEKKINGDEVIITAEDCKYIKWLGQTNSYIHVFSYLEEITFTLRKSQSYHHDLKYYQNIFSNTLEKMILLKKGKPHEDGDFLITHELEPERQTKLRNLYRS